MVKEPIGIIQNPSFRPERYVEPESITFFWKSIFGSRWSFVETSIRLLQSVQCSPAVLVNQRNEMTCNWSWVIWVINRIFLN